jgi:PIN domain nuclease of toxin-antitoxin system
MRRFFARGTPLRGPANSRSASSFSAWFLDTHIWVWYLDGDATRMAPGMVPLLDAAASAAHLRVSDISYWEVAVKTAKRSLVFSIDATVWLNRAGKAPGIAFLPLDRDVLLLSTRLPGTMHNDPADRILIAASQLYSLPLVTADAMIIDYAAAHPGTTVIDARAHRTTVPRSRRRSSRS